MDIFVVLIIRFALNGFPPKYIRLLPLRLNLLPLLTAAYSVVFDMGRPEQRERERNRSAKLCKSLDSFFLSKNVAIPFLDHILFNLDSRFSPLSTTATSLLTLVPAIICARNVELDNAIQVYHDDLPSPELVPQEIIRWNYDMKIYHPTKDHQQ